MDCEGVLKSVIAEREMLVIRLDGVKSIKGDQEEDDDHVV